MKNVYFIGICLLLALSSRAQSDSASFHFQKGKEAYDAKRFRVADQAFAKAYSFQKDHFDLLITWAKLLEETRYYTLALEKYDLAEQIRPNDPGVVLAMAKLYSNLHQSDKVIAYAQKMLDLHIGNHANYLLAKSYFAKEHYGKAIQYCEAAFKEDPKNADVPYIAAHSFMAMNQYKNAALCFEQAIGIDSSNSKWMYEAALSWYAVPNDMKALTWMEKAGAHGYPQTNDYMENLANAYANAGHPQKSIDMLLEVLKSKPQDPELIDCLAESYFKMKKYEESIRYWDMNLKMDPHNASALYMIGLSYQRKGDAENGKNLCDKAILMDPNLKKLREENRGW